MCGGPYQHLDHVKPLSAGGPHMLSNLRPSCADCNLSKGAKWPLPQKEKTSCLPI
ncbi:HNH endonuclease [Rhodococcus erythropolis]|uniref:HNH endonuclease n=1 Tax=Rhodococcus erythropolis TaxID=1833 RepID=UPI001BEA8F9E|nr:HNH endonuclease [Rhodococcus erythropolis]